MLDGNSAAERRYSHDLAVSEERFERLRAEVIEALQDDVSPLIREARIDEALMHTVFAYAITKIYGSDLDEADMELTIDNAIDEIAREWEE